MSASLTSLIGAAEYVPKSFMRPAAAATAPAPAVAAPPQQRTPTKRVYPRTTLLAVRRQMLKEAPEERSAFDSVTVANCGVLDEHPHKNSPGAAAAAAAGGLVGDFTIEELSLRDARRQNWVQRQRHRARAQRTRGGSKHSQGDGAKEHRPPFAACDVAPASIPHIDAAPLLAESPAKIIAAVHHVSPPFLLQSGDTVLAALCVELAVPRALHGDGVCRRVLAYLVGDGFHVLAPAHNTAAGESTYAMLLSLLKFDALRDNRTRVFTELSPRWVRLSTPFEQFLHFFAFRDDRPLQTTVGMLTHRQKPTLVACLTGDVVALVLLAELGFWLLPLHWFTRSSPLLSYWEGGSVETLRCLERLCEHMVDRPERQ